MPVLPLHMSRILPDTRFTEISKRLSRLQTAIESIKNELAFKRDTIRCMLHRRGYTVFRENSRENCILPIKTIKNGDDRFYESLKRYSFRIFLRDVIRLKKFTLKEVSRYSSERTVRAYLKFLEEMRLVKESCLAAPIPALPCGALRRSQNRQLSFKTNPSALFCFSFLHDILYTF